MLGTLSRHWLNKWMKYRAHLPMHPGKSFSRVDTYTCRLVGNEQLHLDSKALVPICIPIHSVWVLPISISSPTVGTIRHLLFCQLVGFVKWHHAAALTCISLITGEVECFSWLNRPKTDWISVIVIGLFRFSPSLLVIFDISVFLGNCPLHLSFHIYRWYYL